MEKINIHITRFGFTNVFLICENGQMLLVDTGSRGYVNSLKKFIRNSVYEDESPDYVFLTHTHYDHAGSVAGMKALSGAKIIVNQREAKFLEKGFTPIPAGTTFYFKIVSKAGKMNRKVERRIGGYQGVKADIEFDEHLSLDSLGFTAKVVHTPGHTTGSSSLICDNRAFVGDCMFNLRGKLFPGFADDPEKLRITWKKMLNWDVEWYYPSHGKRISKQQFYSEARKLNIVS